MLTVTPSIGNTHGVRFKSSPPTNSARSQPSPPPASAASSLLRTPFAAPPAGAAFAVGLTGAASKEAKLPGGLLAAFAPPVSGGAALEAPPVTVTCTVNGTDVGARQTSLLHAWYSTLPWSVCELAVAAAAIGTPTSTVPSYTRSGASSKPNFSCFPGG